VSKQASSQAAWALLTEGVTQARLDSHRLRHLMSRVIELIEDSEHKEHFYQVAGDIIVAAPTRLDHLDTALDRTSLALAKMGQEFLDSRLSLSDKMLVEEAVQSAFGGGGSRQSLKNRVVSRYMTAQEDPMQAVREIWKKKPKVKWIYTSPKGDFQQKKGRGGEVLVKGTLTVGDNDHMRGGAVVDYYPLFRIFQDNPQLEDAIAELFVARVKSVRSQVTAQVKKDFQIKDVQHLLMFEVFGSDDWEITNLKVNRVEFLAKDVHGYMEWWMPLKVHLTFTASKRMYGNAKPFSDMSNRELSEWVGVLFEWDDQRYMAWHEGTDGEATPADMLRGEQERLRGMSPREQQKLFKYLKDYWEENGR